MPRSVARPLSRTLDARRRTTTPASSSVTRTVRRSAISISRMSPVGDPRPSHPPGTRRGGSRPTLPNCRSCCVSRRPLQFPTGRSVASGGVDHGLMSFNRFSCSASDDCEGKGDENESAFHGRIPSLTISAWPIGRGWAVIKITGMLISDEEHLRFPEPL